MSRFVETSAVPWREVTFPSVFDPRTCDTPVQLGLVTPTASSSRSTAVEILAGIRSTSYKIGMALQPHPLSPQGSLFRRQPGLPDCHGAGTSVRRCMPRGVRHPGGKADRPVTTHRASGGNPGQDDPDAARVLDLDPGQEMGTRPGSSRGPEPGRRPCPGTPRRSRPPRPRPPGRRPMRLPGAPIFLFRYHAERRGRAEENARGPAVLNWTGPFGPACWRRADRG